MPIARLVLLAMLCTPLIAQTAISELTSYWPDAPNSSGHLYDYHGAAHALYYPIATLSTSTAIFGSGWGVGSADADGVQGRMYVPSSLNQATTGFIYAGWVQVTRNAVILSIDSLEFRLYWNDSDTARLGALCQDASNNNLTILDDTQIAVGNVALIAAGWDGTDLMVSVNGEAWQTSAQACDLTSINAGDLRLHGNMGRMMSWMGGYTPTNSELAALYNSGAGRDYTYFNASGFTEPTAPLTVSLIDSSFLADADLSGTEGLYFVRPFPCKDWSGITCADDYAWLRTPDHAAGVIVEGAVYLGWSSSPAIAPASWTKILDADDLTTDVGEDRDYMSQVTMVYDGVDEVFLYVKAQDPVYVGGYQIRDTYLYRSSDMSTWTYHGVAFPASAASADSAIHTGYPLVIRRGSGDWIAKTLIRSGEHAEGSAEGYWTSTDGLSWSYQGTTEDLDTPYPWTRFNSHSVINDDYSVLFSAEGAGSGYITDRVAGDDIQSQYPPWHLFSHGGTNSGGDWLQQVMGYEENGVVHIYAKMSFQQTATIAYYRGTLAGESNLSYSFDADEIIELDYLGTDFAQNINSGNNFLGAVYHNDSETQTTCSPTETLNGDGWTHRCNSGGDKDTEVDVTLSQPDGDSLQMVIVVTNHDVDDNLTRIVLDPLEITNPGQNIQNCNNVPRRAGREHGPAFILSGTWGAWTIGMSSFPTGWQLTTFCANEDTVNFDIALTNTHSAAIDDPQDVIGPGESRTITLIMRFGAAGSDVDDLATESFSAWRTLFPYRMSWADPRPIATWFLSSEASVNVTTNPRGFIQSITDWTDESDFTTKMLAATDTVVSLAQGMSPKPQGVVLWDIEGGEFPHAFTYVGKPSAVCSITPEMCYDVSGTPLIDEMVRRLHAGNLRVGFTLRPQDPLAYGDTKPGSCDPPPSAFDDTAATTDYTGTFIETDLSLSPRGNRGWRCNDSGDGWVQDVLYWQRTQDTNAEVIAELSSEIRYAVDRWRASIFYVDSNNINGTYSHEIFDALAKEFPDILILPEWETANYAGSTFPYGELDLGNGGATTAEKRLYPQARRILNIMDGDRDAGASTIVAAMREGSPTLHRGWFSDDSITDTETLYAQARAANGVVTLSTGERYEATIPIVERVGGSCYPNHLAVRFASGTETLNGCNIFTEQGCSSTTLCRSTDSPCTIADTTAYRLEFHNSLQEPCSAGRIGPRLIEIASAGGRVSVNPVTGQLAFDKVVGSYFEVHVADADGSNVTCISCDHADLPTRHIGNPVWSPDGEWIVMQAQKSAASTTDSVSTPGIGVFNDLYAYEVDTDTATLIHSVTLTVPAQGLLHPQFNHAGTKLMWAEMTDGSGGFNGTWKMTIADWSPVTPSLSNLTDYTPSSKTFYETHGWSHDDSKIIYTAAAGAFTDLDIWTWDLSGSPVNLTSDVAGAWDEHAHFSRDGSKIVWMSSRGQSFSPLQADYWIMDADGSNKARLTSFSSALSDDYQGYNAIAADFDWSLDDRVIGYVQQTGTTPDSGKLLSLDAGIY